VKELSKKVILQTCVWEALRLTQISGVHAMHDATEGGIVAALNELAEASSFGFTINWEKLPISRETRVLQDYFKLSDEQILSMSSTGTLLAAVEPKAQEIVEAELNKMGVASSFIGQFTKDKKRILIKNGKKSRFPITANDPYAYLFSRNS
jgi:hydrogenase maturation factor